ncbi:MAG: L,D-transpeptidase family protein [bacterium]|nr:L,D-transpeptidase family protein [bacterium]
MHVPLGYHKKVVGILVGALIALVIVLAIVILQANWFIANSPITNPYLQSKEAVVIASESGGEEIILPIEKVLFEYIEVVDSCDAYFVGTCLNVRSGPGEDYEKIARLRIGAVLKVGGQVERDGRVWYKIVFDEWIRYPERIEDDWYVAADYVIALLDEGVQNLTARSDKTNKKIIVSRLEQKLYAYDGDELFIEESISTGLELTPTPRGIFTVFKKTPSRYMQGPIPGISEKYYDLPGVPWNLYFTSQGAVIHGTYWHQNFGKPSSNGCVNLIPSKAKELYAWADVGTKVIVQD